MPADPRRDVEPIVAERIAAGEPAVFASLPGCRPTIHASLIRRLLLDLVRHGAGPGGSMPGVRISGVAIDGPLDLRNFAVPGAGLPALELTDCDIPEEINLGASRLARLSVARSRITFLNLREAEIDGPFDFSGVEGFDDSVNWIDARGALIHGDVTGARAMLRAPAPRPRDSVADGDRRAALWLAGATIRGSLRLVEGFAADGGVSLDASRISGDVWVVGGLVASRESDAFRAQNATVDGVMILRDLIANGIVWLLGMRIGGALQLSRTWIFGETTPGPDGTRHQDPDERRSALVVGDADIGASVRLTPEFTAHGRVSFEASKIRGYLDASAARIFNRTPDGRARAFNATNAEVGANLLFDGVEAEGRLDIAGAKIGGKLSVLDARLTNITGDRRGQAIEAINTTVGGNVEFGRTSQGDGTRGSRIAGAVNVTGARIGGDLAFTATEIDNLRPDGEGLALIGRQVHVQASIRMNGRFVARGAVILTGATIGRDLAFHDATLCNPERSAVYAKDIEVGDDIKLQAVAATGNLRFERASVAGSVFWQNLTLSIAPDPDPALRRYARLDLMHARVGSAMKCAGITPVGPCLIDLTGLRVATIDVSEALGWGPPHHEGLHCPIRLDGLVYERIEFPGPNDHGPHATGHEPDWTLRRRAGIPVDEWSWLGPRRDEVTDRMLDWLLRDSESATIRRHNGHAVETVAIADASIRVRFHPQPYRQLARVLRAQGHEASARGIAIAEQWATPRHPASRQLHRAFGLTFGFGLRPTFAIVTLLAYVAAGTGLAQLALTHGWLIETPLLAASAYSDTPEKGVHRAFVPADEKSLPRAELPCRDLTDTGPDALVYAVDTVLPFIPLHQETKCELAPDLVWRRFGRALYTVVGWALTSLALLTFSGILRRTGGDAE